MNSQTIPSASRSDSHASASDVAARPASPLRTCCSYWRCSCGAWSAVRQHVDRHRHADDEDAPSAGGSTRIWRTLGKGVLEKLDDLPSEARRLGRRAAPGLTGHQLLAELRVDPGVGRCPRAGGWRRHGGDAEDGLVEAATSPRCLDGPADDQREQDPARTPARSASAQCGRRSASGGASHEPRAEGSVAHSDAASRARSRAISASLT